MNRKTLFVLSGISVVAVSALFVSATHKGTPIIPMVNAASSKTFTFDSAVGAQYWSLGKWDQNVANGQGTPIKSRIELPYEKYCERGFGSGSLFYYKTDDGNGSFAFSFGVNNLQGFEFTFKAANTGWNMASAEFHAVIDYQDDSGVTVYQENYDLVNADTVDEDSDLHANMPITYSWARTQEIVGDAIRKVSVDVSYAHMNRISMDHVTVSWNC